MLIWVGEPGYKIITAVEGTGDNLLDEDIRDGYVDYYMTTMYKQEWEDMEIVDSGQIMLTKQIKDMSYEEKIDAVLDYWGYKDSCYAILEF